MFMRRIALCVLILCSLSCTSENPLSSSSSATDEDSFFSLVDGGKWVYTHQSSAFVMNSYTEIMRGVHTWLVLSKDAGTGVTTYSLQSGEIDTVHYGQYLPSNGNWVETTYVSTSTVMFAAEQSQDSIRIHWYGTLNAGSSGGILEAVPRHVPAGTDTLTFSDDVGFRRVAYVRDIGLVSYSYTLVAAHSMFTESLILIRIP